MKKIIFSFKKDLTFYFILFSFLLIAFFPSCKNEEKPKEIAGVCAVLLNDDIQKNWVDKDFTKPNSNNQITTLDVIAFYNSISSEFTIYIQGVTKNGDIVPGSEIKILEGTSCSPIRSASIPQHNYYKIADLDILEKDGKLKSFNYISFTPSLYASEKYLMNFELSVVLNDRTSSMKGGTLPCPPCINCEPSCATWCTPPCPNIDSTITDSTGN